MRQILRPQYLLLETEPLTYTQRKLSRMCTERDVRSVFTVTFPKQHSD